jgi:hypothetical protein
MFWFEKWFGKTWEESGLGTDRPVTTAPLAILIAAKPGMVPRVGYLKSLNGKPQRMTKP